MKEIEMLTEAEELIEKEINKELLENSHRINLFKKITREYYKNMLNNTADPDEKKIIRLDRKITYLRLELLRLDSEKGIYSSAAKSDGANKYEDAFLEIKNYIEEIHRTKYKKK